ncbi:MAG TPA: OmpH family outer membrane protein [Cytophagaceae bacterium]
MKNISLILNAVLLVAVGVLYYLHFSSDKKETVSAEPVVDTTTVVTEPVELPEIVSPAGTIAFINYDSLIENYDFYQKGIKDLEKSYNSKMNELMQKQKKLEEDLARYQQLAPSLSVEAREARERQLVEDEQKLLELRDKLSKDYARSEEQFSKKFLQKIDDYMKNLAKQKNYSYVFTYSKGGPASIVFANDSLEITKQVVEGLNKQEKIKK